MWTLRIKLPVLVLLAVAARAATFEAVPEFFRPDPFGGMVQSDRAAAQVPEKLVVRGARGGYVSFQLVAGTSGSVSVQLPFEADVFREWFHLNEKDKRYYPDALIPAKLPASVRIPDPDNQINGQTSAAFWVDVWIPPTAKPGSYKGSATLSTGNKNTRLPVVIEVIDASVPETDAVTLDNNSYGTSWLFQQYPKFLKPDGQAVDEDRLVQLIHAYHRIFYDHRTTFHQLGYGHGGKVEPGFAPELEGSGRTKHIANWDRFDRHYGPLLDGSAFRGSRRGPRPIPYVYLPINPEWPASFLFWGEPGYETEFRNVLREMEQHFREKGWTHTNYEVFFNHKKRYKAFPWDGDEIRFERDNNYLVRYREMLNDALDARSPVHFVMRADTSWTMHHQFEQLRGVVNFWVAGEGELYWYPGDIKKLKERGDTVWTYGGTPAVQQVSTAITLHPLRTWMNGVEGFVRWLTVDPGPDPWFKFGGGDLTLVYPGERFGMEEPLPSIRLKLQRNCLQDLALLDALSNAEGKPESLKAEITKAFNQTDPADWVNANAALPDRPILDWTNADFEDVLKPYIARFSNLDASSWLRVRDRIFKEAERAR
jgi:hypothetical protein